MKLDFLIIGAEKCGTTWLADMLRQHPAIFIPPEKELFYFNQQFFESPELHNYNFDQPLAWYYAFFKNAETNQVKGEASVAYIWDQAAPGKIHAFDPTLKIIALLRDPIERAFSHYLYAVQRGYFPAKMGFEEAIEQHPYILTRGLYAQQLERYYKLFPAEQIQVLYYDDLRADNQTFLQGVERFLGVADFIPQNIDERSNVTGTPRFPWVNRLIAWARYPLRKYNPALLMKFIRASGLARLQERLRLANTKTLTEKPTIQPETRAGLWTYFEKDIQALEKITGQDLKAWRYEGSLEDE